MDEHAKVTERTKRGYEDSDVSVRQLFAFGAGVAALVVFGVVVSAVVFRFFVKHQPLGPPASPFENVRQLPPEPRLQTEAPKDLARYRAEEEKILGSYGWVDQKASIVRIPVDRAMSILLQKGYPVRGSSPLSGAGKPAAQLAAPPTGREAGAASRSGEGNK